jgi:hypothetical protein
VALRRHRKRSTAREIVSAAGWLLLIGVAAAFGGEGGIDWATELAVGRDER